MARSRRNCSVPRSSGQSYTAMLLLIQRCIATMENEPFERRDSDFRSSIEGLYSLASQVLEIKDKSPDDYRQQLCPIVERSGATDIKDCLVAAVGQTPAAALLQGVAGEFPLLLPLMSNHLKPFRMRYIPYGRESSRAEAGHLDKLRPIKDDDIIAPGTQLGMY